MAPVATGSGNATELIQALSDPDTYPDHPKQVEVRETHISWVFLAGERAYKLKKPLVLPFLDYGTPERRRRMCDEEVRLNRRLAGALYVRVRSVVATAQGWRLASERDPEALDYLVEMRRYDEGATLASKLEDVGADALAEDVAELARLLARFHAQTRRVTVDRAGASAARRRTEENLRELLEVVDSPTDAARVRVLERFTDAFLAGGAGELDARARAGLVVEGHGDLRAEHVLVNGAVRAVDCIEFDRGRRELDVADELAFLVMDLTRRGAQGLARLLVDSYREAGGEPGGERLIAFYACFRALVRAKVRLLRAAQLPPDGAAQHDQRVAAQELLTLAELFAWRARLPLVVAICGQPAAGKTTLAGALGEVSGRGHLSSDVVRKRAAGVEPQERAPLGAYSAEANRRTYDELGRLAAAALASRDGVIVDATFRHRADRAAFIDALGDGPALLFVECRTPMEVTAARARRREADPARVSDASEAVVVAERHSWEPLEELEPAARMALNCDRPLEHQLSDLRAQLDARLEHPNPP